MKSRLSLPIALGCLLATLAPSFAKQIEGVDVPSSVTVSGKNLSLNGAGVRVVKFSFVPIKAYVAAFYAPTKLDSESAVMGSKGPLKFTFTFLKGVGQSQVSDAWNAQFKASASASYSGLEADQAKFVKAFGPLKSGGVEAVEIDGDSTRCYDDGKITGTVKGRNFQKAFLSMWFGSSPVMPSLKNELLGK